MQQQRSIGGRHDWGIDLPSYPAADGENDNQKQCDQSAQGSSVEGFLDWDKVAGVQGRKERLHGVEIRLRQASPVDFG